MGRLSEFADKMRIFNLHCIALFATLHFARGKKSLETHKTNTTNDTVGLAVAGGYIFPAVATEIWSPTFNCSLPTLPRDMYSPTLDFYQDLLFACFGPSCVILTEAGWQEGPSLVEARSAHTSFVTSQGILLVGGGDSPNTAELVTEGGSTERFTFNPGRQGHCSVQVDSTTMVLTGGSPTESWATEYSGLLEEEVTAKSLPGLSDGRWLHACGAFMFGEETFLLVAGGLTSDGHLLDSTELLAYPAGEAWRTAGPLPSPRYGIVAVSLDGVIHASGGNVGADTGDILSWDVVSEMWMKTGTLEVARERHGLAEVPLDVVSQFCQ